MTRRYYVLLFCTGLALALVVAGLEKAPGYMDADFYYAGALRLAGGQGATELYLWNYLNAPAALPAPSFSYWMPLTSLVAAAGLLLARPLGFWGARLGFIVLSGCIPPLTALLALRLTQKPALARMSGLLALFSGFYLAYLPTTDVFALYMLLGGLFFWLAFAPGDWLARFPVARFLGLGLLAGLFHLARADGLVWLAGAAGAALLTFWRARPLVWARLAAAILAGYALMMAPWFAHNLRAWGGLFPPGGSRALWITAYEQTMLYPASLLTPQHWLAAGWGVHFSAWGEALLANLQTALAVQGGIVLLPFIIAGLWALRGCPEVRLGVPLYLGIAAVMTVVFPFAGTNGGFFHSGAAFQPLFWAAAPLGVETLMLRYARWRRAPRPWGMVSFMSALLVGVAGLLSLLLVTQRVIGPHPEFPAWSASAQHYRAVERDLQRLGAQPGDAVIVNNPPGYWLASGRPAVVIPDGDASMLLQAARQYRVRYLVLEITNPAALGDLYHARISPPALTYLDTVGQTRLYRVDFSTP